MCGICFSVKQSYTWRRRGPSKPARPAGTPASTSHVSGSTAPRKPPPTTTPTPLMRELPMTPCPAAEDEVLRTLPLHDCRWRYVAPSADLLRSAPGSELFLRLLHIIRRRGPETFGATRRLLEARYVHEAQDPTDGSWHGLSMSTELQGVSAVLGLRGHATVHQPFEMEVETDLEDEDGRAAAPVNKSFLLWNGEIFNGSMCPPPWGSDTVVLASRLSQLEQECVPTCEADPMHRLPLRARQERFLSRCVQAFEEEVQGPYGFLFYANQLQLAVFGRDPLGRHSLLAHLTVMRQPGPVADAAADTPALEAELVISSVGVQHVRGDRKRRRPSGSPVSSETAKDAAGARASPPAPAREAEESDSDEERDGGCWLELPVTGLFALPLDQPLIDVTSVPPPTSSPTAAAEVCGSRLMHCPWRDRFHLVHPLLRAFTAAARAGEAAGEDGLPTDWTPPSRPLRFQSTDTVPALPPMLAERVAAAAPAPNPGSGEAEGRDGEGDRRGGGDHPRDGEDAVWAHWAATCYLHALAAAVRRRTDVAAAGAEDTRDWANICRALRRPLCVLFSGGIDCTVLAALAHYVLPLETPIELVNVAFGDAPAQAPDRIAALRAVGELVRLPPPPPHPDALAAAAHEGWAPATEREWRLVLVDVPDRLSADTAHILDLVAPRHTVMDLDIGSALWYAARGQGRMQSLRRSDLVEADGVAAGADGGGKVEPTMTTPAGNNAADAAHALKDFNKHVRHAPAPGQTPVAIPVTVSDSPSDKFQMLIEVLVTEARQGDGPSKPVLLSTLGKEYGAYLQPHLAAHGYRKMGAFLNDACQAGLITFCPNAPSKAVGLVREEDRRRATPPPPCRWYVTPQMRRAQEEARERAGVGSAGEELLPPAGTYEEHYVSKAKVLLLGMGADETLGGYTRYRRFFGRHGMHGTRVELEKDFARLWRRNLGRDDRITMDSGREPRFPYLDEELLMTLEKIVAERRHALLAGMEETANGEERRGGPEAAADLLQASLEPVVSFALPPGQGDKRVLRNVAAILGLDTVTRLQKRAIQFGSRIADRRVCGSAEL